MSTLVAVKVSFSGPLKLAIPGSYTEGTWVPFNGLGLGLGDTLAPTSMESVGRANILLARVQVAAALRAGGERADERR